MVERVAHWWGRQGVVARLMLTHALILSLAIGFVLFQVERTLDQQSSIHLNQDLAEQLTQFSHEANSRSPGTSLQAFSLGYLRSHVLPGGFQLLVDVPGGGVLGSGRSSAMRSDPRIRAWLVRPPAQTTVVNLLVGKGLGQMRVLATPIVLGGRRAGSLVLGAQLEDLQAENDRVLSIGAIEGGAALAVAMAAAFLLLRRVLVMVGKVTRAADEIGRGDISRRIAYRGPDDEVGRLARTFNVMLGRLEHALHSQRDLLADVSHQLRTPLTVMRGHLEMLNAEVLDQEVGAQPEDVAETVALVLDELDHMALLVDRLLLLGGALEPDFIAPAPVELRTFLADVFDAARVLAPRDWGLGLVPEIVVLVDQVKLRGALLNLLDNAVKATGPGDRIGVDAELADELVLRVTDTGRGISEEQRERVFERFVRGSAGGQRGSGLGLAIVRAVVEAHGGRVLLQSWPGQGTSIELHFPCSIVTDMTSPTAAAPSQVSL